jgi:hypothetical protein
MVKEYTPMSTMLFTKDSGSMINRKVKELRNGQTVPFIQDFTTKGRNMEKAKLNLQMDLLMKDILIQTISMALENM